MSRHRLEGELLDTYGAPASAVDGCPPYGLFTKPCVQLLCEGASRQVGVSSRWRVGGGGRHSPGRVSLEADGNELHLSGG